MYNHNALFGVGRKAIAVTVCALDCHLSSQKSSDILLTVTETVRIVNILVANHVLF